MNPTKSLPMGYELRRSIDLSKNRPAMLGLNLAAVILLLVFGYLFLRLATLLRPEATAQSFSFSGNALEALLFILAVLAISAVMVVLHEGVHGLFFWSLTRERPKFGFRGAYAYAAAPDWYLPRNPYLWVGLSPLVVLTAIGVLALIAAPQPALLYILIFMVLNAAGAVGDLAVVFLLLTQPSTVLVNDSGDAVSVYAPGLSKAWPSNP
jgi:hypothetical protein